MNVSEKQILISSQANPENPERMSIAFRAGTGGLHSAEN